MDPDDRSAILARRALLVGSMLTAVACSGSPAPIPPPPTAAPETSAAVAASSAPPRSVTLPSTTPPEGISERERSAFEAAVQSVQQVRAWIAGLQADAEACPFGDPGCEAKWKAYAEALVQLEDWSTGGCGYMRGTPVFLIEFATAHGRDVRARAAEQIVGVGAALRENNVHLGKWAEWVVRARSSKPRSCLSCGNRTWNDAPQ